MGIKCSWATLILCASRLVQVGKQKGSYGGGMVVVGARAVYCAGHRIVRV